MGFGTGFGRGDPGEQCGHHLAKGLLPVAKSGRGTARGHAFRGDRLPICGSSATYSNGAVEIYRTLAPYDRGTTSILPTTSVDISAWSNWEGTISIAEIRSGKGVSLGNLPPVTVEVLSRALDSDGDGVSNGMRSTGDPIRSNPDRIPVIDARR